MKYAAALSAMVAAAQAVQPLFTNTAFDVQPNQPFTLTYNPEGCATGCTISLKAGPSTQLVTVKDLTTSATGSSFTVTPAQDWPAGPLAFEIRNAQDPPNYSSQFPFAGTGAAPSSSRAGVSSSAPVGSSSLTSAMTPSTSGSSESAIVTGAPSSTGLLTNASTTTTSMSTAARNMTAATRQTSGDTSSITTVPSSGVDRLSASLALVAGVAAAMVCLN